MSSFQFQNPTALYFLWLVPVIFIFAQYFQKQAQKKIQKSLGSKLLPFLTSSVSISKRRIKLYLECLVLFFLILALARPQLQDGTQKVKNEGIEIVLLVDVSNSMLAEDVKPSRMDLAKSELKRLIDISGGDRFGLVAFAGSAVLLSPMSTDQNSIKMFIDSLSPDAVSTQGTDFKRGLDESKAAFERGGADKDDSAVTRAILIVSDGEDNEPGAIEAAKKLVDDDIYIFTLAIGTEKGGTIPIKDDRGEIRGYRRDQSGQVVLTQTKGTVLKQLAEAGKGSFHHATFQGDAIKQVRSDIERLQKSQFADGEIKTFQELYQYFLFLAFLVALFEISMGERASAGRIWRGRFEVVGR
ncbi:MAG: VWA domain-containing protein [Bdellovibrionota bacterium]